MLGQFCRDYRLSKGVTLKDIEGNDHIKALSAFEMGRSTNYEHFLKYALYAQKIGDYENFTIQFTKALRK